ncbi:glycosyltransferase [Paenibacillus sp. H1-7]|uniref:glycosyltransferase family 2 protein n=1 Tax=Paenibacillus sp. H1-7 TaxID=2282849 RepID=UPI001EF88203|nr:glycosyltransferase family 2 protein [Paenibacillus sp. H1-7]ULL15225.1 glycosyltransferase [Paenibacillus sp. H1-7]
MKFSVIIPTYNRSLQLMLTLASFEKQTVPMDQFEIIVVNDGSSDDILERLQHYQPPYRLQVVSLNETSGRSAARNAGVHASQEDYLIFCDPDFLVTPRFIEVHAAYHKKYPNAVVSGVPKLWKSIYTHLHADFSDQERLFAAEVLQRAGLWNDQYAEQNRTFEIVTPEDVRNETGMVQKVIAPWDIAGPIQRQYSKTDVAPWLLCVTRDVSMSKQLFQDAGGFDEKFRKYGFEDWELGYRLHRKGIKFISMKEALGYHQEHSSASRRDDPGNNNLKMGLQTHGCKDPELSLFTVISPSEDVQIYKNSLRILQKLRSSNRRRTRYLAKMIRRACTKCANLLLSEPDSPEHSRFRSVLRSAFIETDRVFSLRRASKKRKLTKIKRIMAAASLKLEEPDDKKTAKKASKKKKSRRRRSWRPSARKRRRAAAGRRRRYSR